ncbi:MAG: UvrD-helicase domain-containing protein [Actinobacteria bacterium]|nr:UvrD-helicase domain-containing protein [Actinomycetota bacterium]
MIQSTSQQHLLENLTCAQHTAVTHRDGPLLVLAGPGSGKTRVITHRVAYLMATGVQGEHILALTFTNKAAAEMRSRVIGLVGAAKTTICTFHSLCARLLREFAEELSLTPNFSIFDRADSLAALREATQQSGLDPKNWPPAATCEKISRAKSKLLRPAEYQERANDFYTKQVAKIYRRYQQVLESNSALDFDDLLLRMVDALRENESIRRQLAGRYRYILIDEYQDTNQAQYVIGRVLCRDHQNICATGDPDQSIYGWRGADISNILDFERDFPQTKIVRLEQNYRSTKHILAAADRLIKANKLRRDKKLWTENPEGEKIEVVCCADGRAEAGYVAERIAEYVQGGSYNDVAIFYRVNSLSRPLEQALRSAGVPYQMVRGVAFYARKEIKDVLAYLRAIVNPNDELSLLRIINVPARKIGAKTVQALREHSRRSGATIRETLATPGIIAGLGRAAGPLKQFAVLLDELVNGPQRPVQKVLERVIRRTNLEAEYSTDRHKDGTAMDNINELISSAAQYDKDNPEGNLEDYLQQTSLVCDVDSFDPSQGAVAMMTLHAAKGLEFPVVFMVGLEDGLLPHSRAAENRSELEEERRLCFVGMTRAQRRLVMSYARYRQVRGSTNRTVASGFLAELPAESVRHCQCEVSAGTESLAKLVKTPDALLQRSSREGSNRRAGRSGFVAGLIEGSSVYHPRYGLGKIEQIGRFGKFTRAVIDFEETGPQTMMLEYADLHKPTSEM